MVNGNVKETMRGKLANAELAEDLKKSKIEKSIHGIKEVDGKIKAEYCVEGLNKDKKSTVPYRDYDDNRWTKIFDSWDELSQYSKGFFDSKEDELKEIVKNNK
jgi:hypothetical protein